MSSNAYFCLSYLSSKLLIISILALHTVLASPSQHSPHTYHSLPRSFRSRPQSNAGYTSILVPALIVGGIIIVALVLFAIVRCVTKDDKKDDDAHRRRRDRASSDDAHPQDDNEGDDLQRNNVLRDEEEGRVSEGKKKNKRAKKAKRNKEEAPAEAQGDADDEEVNPEAEARLQMFKAGGDVGQLSQSMDADAIAILQTDDKKQTFDKARLAEIEHKRELNEQKKKNKKGGNKAFESHKADRRNKDPAQKALKENFTPLSINNPYQDKVAVTVPDHIEAVEQPEEEWADNKAIFSKMSEYVPQGMLDDDCDDF